MIAFRQHGTTRYADAESVPAGILAGLARTCAECGADLTSEPGAATIPAALFVYPGATFGIGADTYACPACLACVPKLAARLAQSLDDDPTED